MPDKCTHVDTFGHSNIIFFHPGQLHLDSISAHVYINFYHILQFFSVCELAPSRSDLVIISLDEVGFDSSMVLQAMRDSEGGSFGNKLSPAM